ncbi:GNAT family N-acetyltransferase [Staphylococcus simiae]|uniref:GNAT family N-acetyltransferase n=1 Tax=Staphylococcus simiae TaxID=308354 RepID=UPI001A9633EA|nr:GNAT family N-acetyltransferase [Staphylococcus simiae]MBO1198853.1 GNAT family N-acetyltransferase [Staphylococcus simiae]MBO1201050.1 GNAT family N-acetyltransferase [Staphylococcus simiae]MBO1204029.1 GNAT family N-acetyltransferase [Staphylococcus simiae]MBO1211090.1 GNAT family N-acetyltransferase [Staphylococcus simiae]MBO1229357.1 GNAT family N-acetyltransferase [Staphylococcus simiae]
MREINISESDYLWHMATIQEHMLDKFEAHYHASSLSIALRYEMIVSRLQNDKDKIYIIEEHQQLIAFIWAHLDKVTMNVQIEMLYVNEWYRSRGLATQLKKQVEQWGIEHHAKQISGTINSTNEDMIALNNHLGYDVSHVIMTKHLT